VSCTHSRGHRVWSNRVIGWSDHAITRYNKRGTADDSHGVALEKSGPVIELRGCVSYDADQLRLYAPPDGEDLLLVVRDSTVVTVLFAQEYRIKAPEGRRCCDCGAFGEIVVANGCSYCSDSVKRIQETSA